MPANKRITGLRTRHARWWFDAWMTTENWLALQGVGEPLPAPPGRWPPFSKESGGRWANGGSHRNAIASSSRARRSLSAGRYR